MIKIDTTEIPQYPERVVDYVTPLERIDRSRKHTLCYAQGLRANILVPTKLLLLAKFY